MNTIDIELPPLPEPEYIQWVDGVPAISVAEHTDIAKQYAREAIEADRKRRGEPVKVLSFIELTNLAIEYGIMAGPVLKGSRHAQLSESERFDTFVHTLLARFSTHDT